MNYRHTVQSHALGHYMSFFYFCLSMPCSNLGQWLYICCPMFVTWRACISTIRPLFIPQLLQQLKKLICDLCRLYNLPQHPDVEMLDQPLPAGPVGPDRKARLPDALPSSHRPWRVNGLVFECGQKVYIYRCGRGKLSLLMFPAEPSWPASLLTSVWWGACSEQINSLCLWSPAARGTVL